MEKKYFENSKFNYWTIGVLLACAVLTLIFCFFPFTVVITKKIAGIELLNHYNHVVASSLIVFLVCICLDILLNIGSLVLKAFNKIKLNDIFVKSLLIFNCLISILAIIMLTLIAKNIINLQIYIYLVLAGVVASSIIKIYDIYNIL